MRAPDRVVAVLAVLTALALVPAGPVPAVAASPDNQTGGPWPGEAAIIAGTSESGFSGDGGDARGARLGDVLNLDVGSDDTVYIADVANDRVRTVRADGTIDTLVELDHLSAVAVHDDRVYVATDYNVVRIDPDGSQTIIGGPVERGSPDVDLPGDHGPATKAHINEPFDIAVGSDGTVYLAEVTRIRAIRPTGTITTIAGGGRRRLADAVGGPATAARVYPRRIAVYSQGAVYFHEGIEEPRGVVWKVDRDGIITTFAGIPRPQDVLFVELPLGDGGPALEARLSDRLRGMYVDHEDAVYVVDSSQCEG